MLAIIEKIAEFVAGIFVDRLGAASASKPKLQFAITGTRPGELIDKKIRTKYSNSDYSNNFLKNLV